MLEIHHRKPVRWHLESLHGSMSWRLWRSELTWMRCFAIQIDFFCSLTFPCQCSKAIPTLTPFLSGVDKAKRLARDHPCCVTMAKKGMTRSRPRPRKSWSTKTSCEHCMSIVLYWCVYISSTLQWRLWRLQVQFGRHCRVHVEPIDHPDCQECIHDRDWHDQQHWWHSGPLYGLLLAQWVGDLLLRPLVLC